MKAVVETRNSLGESLERIEVVLDNYTAATDLISSYDDNSEVVRVVVFEDVRPEGVISLVHDPRYFRTALDAQRNPETEQFEVIGESWPT